MGWPLGIPGGAGGSESEVPRGGVAPGTVSPPTTYPRRSQGLWVRSARRVRPSTVSPPGGPSGAKRPCSPGLPAGLVAVPLSSRGSGVPVTTSLLSDTHPAAQDLLIKQAGCLGHLGVASPATLKPRAASIGPRLTQTTRKNDQERRDPLRPQKPMAWGIRPGSSFFL